VSHCRQLQFSDFLSAQDELCEWFRCLKHVRTIKDLVKESEFCLCGDVSVSKSAVLF